MMPCVLYVTAIPPSDVSPSSEASRSQRLVLAVDCKGLSASDTQLQLEAGEIVYEIAWQNTRGCDQFNYSIQGKLG